MADLKPTETQHSRASTLGRRRSFVAVRIALIGAPLLAVALSTAWGLFAIRRDITFTQGATEAAVLGVLMCIASAVGQRWAIAAVRPLVEIRRAIHAAHRGEPHAEALMVTERWGADAAAWNSLLDRFSNSDAATKQAGEVAGRAADCSFSQRHFDAMPHGVVLVDGALNIAAANSASALILGRRRDELTGQSFLDVLAQDKARSAVESLRTGARRRIAVEFVVARHGQENTLRLTMMRPAGDATCPEYLALLEDITQQAAADQARDTFLAHATHELRTPLTNIRLYAEMLLEDEVGDPAMRGKAINVINLETRRLERMVGDMLSISEIESGSMAIRRGDVRMDALLTDIQHDYEAQAADRKLTLTFDLSPRLPVIDGDRDKIAMAIHNIVGNAIKYTPAGGAVTVHADEADGLLTLRITDTGIGISPTERDRVFEKFYRSQDKRVTTITGTGLGLTLAREVARLHGGDVTLDSQLDKGSTFTLTLPSIRRAAA